MTGEYFRIAYMPNRKMRRRVLSSSTQLMSHHEIDVHVHLGLGGLPYNQVSEKKLYQWGLCLFHLSIETHQAEPTFVMQEYK